MSRNGSGLYTLPAGNPVVTLTTIATAWANNTLQDIANELTNSLDKGGRTAPTANLPMAGFKHTGAAAPVTGGDYLVWGAAANVTNLTATGNTALGDAAGETLSVANGSLLLDSSGNLRLASGGSFQIGNALGGSLYARLSTTNLDANNGSLVLSTLNAGAFVSRATLDQTGNLTLNGGGRLQITNSSGGNEYGAISANNADANNGGLSFLSRSGGVLTTRLNINAAGDLTPNVDSGSTLGSATRRFSTVFTSVLSDGATATGTILSSSGSSLFVGAGSAWTGIALFAGGASIARTQAGAFRPENDNVTTLGTASQRWTVVYATTGTINTSDGNSKTEVSTPSLMEVATARACLGLVRKYKLKDSVEQKGRWARWHFGLIAQDVQKAFAAHGLDAEDYGLFCADELEDGTTRLGLRYEELLAFILICLG